LGFVAWGLGVLRLGVSGEVVWWFALRGVATVERIWHIQDGQGHVLALAFRLKFLKTLRARLRPTTFFFFINLKPRVE